MKPASAKAKGRLLQNVVRDKILEMYPQLEAETDVRSAIMGETGEDVKLSKKARQLFPFSVECKSLKTISVYRHYEQCRKNCPVEATPLVVIKENRKRPLAVVDFEYFMEMVNGSNKNS